MSVFTTLGVSLAVVALSTLVAGDLGSVVKINNIKVTNRPNDYFEPWTIDVSNGKGSSVLSATIAAKKDVPETMQVKFYIVPHGQDPIEYSMSFCDGLEDELIGRTITAAGIPEENFPKQCPYIAGDWAVSNWDPPTEKIPPGVADGPMSGYMHIFEEGKETCVEVDFEGLSICCVKKSCMSIVHLGSLTFRDCVDYAGWINIQCFDDDETDDNVERVVVSKCHAHSCQTS